MLRFFGARLRIAPRKHWLRRCQPPLEHIATRRLHIQHVSPARVQPAWFVPRSPVAPAFEFDLVLLLVHGAANEILKSTNAGDIADTKLSRLASVTVKQRVARNVYEQTVNVDARIVTEAEQRRLVTAWHDEFFAPHQRSTNV